MAVPIPGGAVNIMYNEITFSNLVHHYLAARNSFVLDRKNHGVIARRKLMGHSSHFGQPFMVVHAYYVVLPIEKS